MSWWWQESKSWSPDELALGKYIRRLSEVQEELSEIGKILQASADRVNPNQPQEQLLSQITNELNRVRIPGFCAYKLAEEGLALLRLISVKIMLLRQAYENEGNHAEVERMDQLGEQIENSHEPLMLRTLEEMKPYSTMDAKKIIGSIPLRARNQRT